jgi:hypothetical protein
MKLHRLGIDLMLGTKEYASINMRMNAVDLVVGQAEEGGNDGLEVTEYIDVNFCWNVDERVQLRHHG